MKRKLLCGAVLGCAFATTAIADGDIFLDFEDPETADTLLTPNPYHGILFSENTGSSDMAVMDIGWYNATYGASLNTLSGDQVGWSDGGVNNILWTLPGKMFLNHGSLTPWIGFGPSSVTVHGFNDGVEVLTVDFAMVENSWTTVDFGGVGVDSLLFENGGDSQWYLFEDWSLKKIPSPGAIALLGLGLVSAGRRRRSA